MNSYKKLIGNSAIFAIGGLGSKLVNIILVPLYTYYLSTTEYGTTDVILTTVSMLVPIASFSTYDAVMRFVIDKNSNKASVLTNSIVISLFGILITLSFYPLLFMLDIFPIYLKYMYVILAFQIFERLFAQYSRGVGKIKTFALNGILLTFSTGILNILFIVVLKMGANGYFISMCLANLISIVYLFFSCNIFKYIDVRTINRKIMHELLKYSIPLIPNSLMWFMINASSKYFVLYFVGLTANGLFAVASRVPTLINLISQFFTQAWQLSAIEEYDKYNASTFYTKVMNYFTSIMFIGSSLLIISIKPLFHLIFSADYYSAWEMVPFLVLGTVFSSFSGFLGATYIATKQTKGVFTTSIYGGVSALILNALLIPTLGVNGAGIASMFGFFIMFILRYKDTKQFINISLNIKVFIWSLSLIFIQIALMNLNLVVYLEFLSNSLVFIGLLFINRGIVEKFLKLTLIYLKKVLKR